MPNIHKSSKAGQVFQQPQVLAYRVSEAAEVSGLGRTTLYTLMNSGQLPYTKIGKRRVIPSAGLQALVDPSGAPAR